MARAQDRLLYIFRGGHDADRFRQDGIGLRPLLNLVETMVISGIVLFGFGFLGEMIAGMREETRDIARELARIEKHDPRD